MQLIADLRSIRGDRAALSRGLLRFVVGLVAIAMGLSSLAVTLSPRTSTFLVAGAVAVGLIVENLIGPDIRNRINPTR